MVNSRTTGSPTCGYNIGMTRIAVLADIHGNLPAFEAALVDVASCDVDEVLLAGDLVGRGPQGSAVVSRARELGLKSVRGNHEDYLLSFRRHEVPEEWLDAEEWACSRWMAAELTEMDAEFIDSFPFSMTASTDPGLEIFHGSPASYNEGLGTWSDEASIHTYLAGIKGDALVCGHTHRPAVWRLDDGLVANVGSVGLPFNADTRAQYAIFFRQRDGWQIEPRAVNYDRQAIYDAYERTGFLEHGGATAALLRREVASARPHLVPFLKWAEVLGREPLLSNVPEFLREFDPTLSLERQYKRLQELRARRTGQQQD